MLGEMCRGSNWDYSSELREEEEVRNRNLKVIRTDTTVWKHENRENNWTEKTKQVK